MRRWTGSVAALVLLAACGEGPGAAAAPEVGQPAPAYGAVAMGGDSVSLASLKGQPVLLNVWATWCHPCREELPDLEQLHQTLGPRGLRVVGVSIDEAGSRDAVADFAREFGVTYDLWLDPADRISSRYRLIGVPSTFLIDADGVLLWKHMGPVKADNPELRAALDRALPART